MRGAGDPDMIVLLGYSSEPWSLHCSPSGTGDQRSCLLSSPLDSGQATCIVQTTLLSLCLFPSLCRHPVLPSGCTGSALLPLHPASKGLPPLPPTLWWGAGRQRSRAHPLCSLPDRHEILKGDWEQGAASGKQPQPMSKHQHLGGTFPAQKKNPSQSTQIPLTSSHITDLSPSTGFFLWSYKLALAWSNPPKTKLRPHQQRGSF